MRSPEEVEAAIGHFRDTLPISVSRGEEQQAADMMRSVDLLNWVLGKPSAFEAIFRACNDVDRARRQ